MAWTQDQIRALEMAYAQGVLEVQYPDGTRKRYRDLDEMERILNRMKAQVGGGGRSRRRFASVSKGL
ncbi:hypothetical protein D3C87_655810 [compost metagenome]